MRIYGDLASGNCQKIKMTADHLGVAYDWVKIDIMKGESRTPQFLAMNPAGQVPVVDFGDGKYLAQSNAIVRYLARDSALLPKDPFQQAKVDEWLFWEQYSHEPYIATTRYHMVYLKRTLAQRETWRVERGEKALERMETHLENREWLVGDALSVADVALVAYTRMAPEGGFDLTHRRHLRRWIGRCEKALKLEPSGEGHTST